MAEKYFLVLGFEPASYQPSYSPLYLAPSYLGSFWWPVLWVDLVAAPMPIIFVVCQHA